MRDRPIGRHPPSVVYSEENSGSNWISTTVSEASGVKNILYLLFLVQCQSMSHCDSWRPSAICSG